MTNSTFFAFGLSFRYFNALTNNLNPFRGSFCPEVAPKNINGISICPKKNYFIIRIWIKNSEYAIKEHYKINIPKYTTILYKKHN